MFCYACLLIELDHVHHAARQTLQTKSYTPPVTERQKMRAEGGEAKKEEAREAYTHSRSLATHLNYL
jgi:hypothetical protein